MRRAGTQDSESDRPVVFTIRNTSVNSEHTWRYSLIKRRCRDDALNLDGDFWQVALYFSILPFPSNQLLNSLSLLQ